MICKRHILASLILLAVASSGLSRAHGEHTPGLQESVAAKREGRLASTAFEHAYGLINELSPADRVETLLHLSKASRSKFPARSGEWAKEALAAAREVRSSKERAQYEAQAVSDLAFVDSKEALDLLATLEVPAGFPDYDPRSMAAEAVFSHFLDKYPAKYQQIYAVAQQIGDYGLYPFAAVRSVIARIATGNPAIASTFVQQAVQYHKLGRHTPIAMNQFTTLLVEHSKFIPPRVLKAMVIDLLSAILDHNNSISGITPGSRSDNDQLNAMTLALLMPLLDTVDADLSQKARAKAPVLNPNSTNVTISSDDEPTFTSQLTLSGSGAMARYTGQPAEPGTSSDSIPDASVSLVSPSFEQSYDWIARTESALRQASTDEEKLRLLVARAEALVSAGQKSAIPEMVTEIFARAESLFKKSMNAAPEAKWLNREGSAELVSLVGLTGRDAPELLLGAIQNVNTPVLQAHLYVALGEALEKPAGVPSFVALDGADQHLNNR